MPNGAPSRLSAALSGRYSIERELGEGGMATVYLAEDLKHSRKVAIKVLKPELAAVLGAERFVQEIATTAALQHPNILPLFDSGSAGGFLFYVMPYVEGETLRARLDRETQMGVEESVKLVSEVADALEYAHTHGVVHRDIKPENILIHAGRPMVADFGIALAVSAAAGGRMTETGLSLGTPHYMSPEQATADKDITARSDVYSLASVLYEMLTGDPPHTGKSAQQIIAKIVTEDPAPVTKVRRSVPPNVAAALTKALEKLPADRFDSAKRFADALASPAFRHGAGGGARATAGGARGRRRDPVFLAVSALAVLGAAAALWGWLRPSPPVPVVSYSLALPAADRFLQGVSAPMPAPDGSFLVYNGPGPGGSGASTQLWIKRRDRAAPTPIPGTDGAESFAISPDGRWVAFAGGGAAGGVLRKVPVDGGAAVTLATGDVALLKGLAWLDDGVLVFPDDSGLDEVPASGGTVSSVYADDSVDAYLPSPLPGGRGVLFVGCPRGGNGAGCDVWALDLRTKAARRVLATTVQSAQYLPSGHIAYATPAGGLFAVAFDVGRMQARGSPIPISDSLFRQANVGSVPFQVSRSGTLVMQKSAEEQPTWTMVWVDQHGRETPVDSTWTFHLTTFQDDQGWALSPDGSALAIGLHTGSGDDIWVKQLPAGPVERITYDPAPDYRPRWAMGGRYVSYLGGGGLRLARPDGVGQDSLLVPGVFDEGVVSPDGRWYLMRRGAASSTAGGRDIVGFQPGVDTALVPVIADRYDEEAIELSPDGRWLAYQSDGTGRTQVFVRPFPKVDSGKQQVSRAGGAAPLWSRDGRELFYLRADSTMMAVRVAEAGTTLRLSAPRALFKVPADLLGGGMDIFHYTPWDVAADGRFIMAKLVSTSTAEPESIIVVRNWLQNWERSLKR